MKTRNVACSVLAIAVLTLSFGYTYQRGFSRGSAYERLHCSAHRFLQATIRVDQAHGVNVMQSPHLP